MLIEYFEYTDKGSRALNEDAIKVVVNDLGCLACIADGVGGAGCGELASKTAIDSVFHYYSNRKGEDLRGAVISAHLRVKELQNKSPEYKNMATTLTCCYIEENKLQGIHVGDSRLCILRGNGIKQLTEPHTEAYRLYKSGKLKFDAINDYPRKHIIESAIGINRELIIQEFEFKLEFNDKIILTTDGVLDVISKVEFRDLSKEYSDIKKFGEAVVDCLKGKKVTDNISFIALKIIQG